MADQSLETAVEDLLAELKKPGTVALAVKHYIVTRLVDRLLTVENAPENLSFSTTVTTLNDTVDDDGSATHTVHHEFHIGSLTIGWDTTETVSHTGDVGVTLQNWS